MKITFLGPGAWGTALAKLAHEGGHAVTLWGHAERLAKISHEKENSEYLPGVSLPENWILEADAEKAVADAGAVFMAVPSRSFREVSANLAGYDQVIVSVTKCIEHQSGLTMGGILKETAPGAAVAALSGPSLASEVASGIPTVLVCASKNLTVAETVQGWFHCPTLRIYTSSDLQGVELGGALKNVMAIAAGVCDGLQLGDNAKAALVTRALTEMRRLGSAAGAQPDTFNGLSGMGDLMVTCFSQKSRNRTLGERLAKGESLETVLAGATVEGYPTTKSAHALARQLGVSTPIVDEVHAMLYEGKAPTTAVNDLMTREPKGEL